MRHAAILLLLALPALALAEGPAAPTADAGYAVPLHRLTEAEARRLDGKRGLWCVRIEAVGWGPGPMNLLCESPDDVKREVRLRRGQEVERSMLLEPMLVEATLHVHSLPGGQVLEFRLEDAVRR